MNAGSWGHHGEILSPVCCPNCGSARVDTAPQSGRDEYRCQCCGLQDAALSFRPSHLPEVARPVPPSAERLSLALARDLNISVALARRMVRSVLPPRHRVNAAP